jgi:protein-L-isoaspartate O-methyltransferase
MYMYCKGRSATTRPYQLHTWYVFPLIIQSQALKARQKKKKQHAHAVELLLPYLRDRPAGSGSGGGARVLDVGAGSGYLTSVFYQLVFRNTQPQPQSQQEERGESERTSAVVVGIEHIPALAALAEKNIRADGLGKAIDERGIVLVTGDGRLGAFPSSPPPPLLFWNKTGNPYF